MEVTICIPNETDLRLIKAMKAEYSDVYEDEGWTDHRRFYEGQSSDDDSGDEEDGGVFLTEDEAIACCGFCEGLIPGCNTLIEGNGAWAQSQLGRLDFSHLVVSELEKAERLRCSHIWLKAKVRGEEMRVGITGAGGRQKDGG